MENDYSHSGEFGPSFTGCLKSIDLFSGQSVEVSAHINLIIGPNNSGKSRMLRDLSSLLNRSHDQTVVAKSFLYAYDESVEAILGSFIDKATMIREHDQFQDDDGLHHVTRVLAGEGFHVWEEQVKRDLCRGRTIRSNNRAARLLGAADRLSMTDRVDARVEHQSETPLLEAFALDDKKHDALSSLTRDLFGFDVDIWQDGRGYQLVAGKIQTTRDHWGEFQDSAKERPKIQEQGDGVRSLIGIAMALLTDDTSILLIDEPEAFLHPPQARKLGKFLAAQSRQRQLIISTHSSDLLEGVLEEGATTDIALHRLTRVGNLNSVAALDPLTVRLMATDTLLRHANLTDGLFADAVAICEADRDATYYSAVFDVLTKSLDDKKALDVHFTHSLGGKARIVDAAIALKDSGVPIASIIDMDLLSDTSLVRRLIEAQGGELTDKDHSDLKTIQDKVREKSTLPTREEVASIIRPLLNRKEHFVREDEIASLREVAKVKSGWTSVKEYGIGVFKGESLEAIRRVDCRLRSRGIFMVPVGELESFDKGTTSDRKDRWISEVLGQKRYIHHHEALTLLGEVSDYYSNQVKETSLHGSN